MEILSLLLGAGALLVLVYVIRSLRALHQKVGRQTERLSNGIQKINELTRNSSIQDYRQLEAYVQLHSLVKFSAPLPATRAFVRFLGGSSGSGAGIMWRTCVGATMPMTRARTAA